MKTLLVLAVSEHNSFVLATARAGRSNPSNSGAPASFNGAFFMCCPSMVGDAGQPARVGRVPSSRFATPASSATSSVAKVVADSNLTRSLL